MWNSIQTDQSSGIASDVITFEGGGGDQIHAYVAGPRQDARRGGIVVLHHMPGWDEFYREFCDRLTRHGMT